MPVCMYEMKASKIDEMLLYISSVSRHHLKHLTLAGCLIPQSVLSLVIIRIGHENSYNSSYFLPAPFVRLN